MFAQIFSICSVASILPPIVLENIHTLLIFILLNMDLINLLIAYGIIFIWQFNDDSECSALCSILSEIRPVEIVKPAKLLSAETERVLLKHTRNPLVNELIPNVEFWDADRTLDHLKRIYGHNNDFSAQDGGLDCLPDVLLELVKTDHDSRSALSALGGALYYLKQAFLDEQLLRFAQFELLPCAVFSGLASKPYMVLDVVALENLEIFENSRNGESSGYTFLWIYLHSL
jgi:DNA mismatch repair protein MSH6